MDYYFDNKNLESWAELVPENMVAAGKSEFHNKFLRGGVENFDGRVFSVPCLFSGVEIKYKIAGTSIEIQRKGYLPVHFEEKVKLTSGMWYLHNTGGQITVSTSSSDANGGFSIGKSADYKALAFMLQGGGGGGAARNLFHAGGGGGAGGTLLCITLIPTGVWPMSVGSQGFSGRGDNQCGNAGGQSYIVVNGNTYAAYGGSGGGTGSESALGNGGSGGGTSSGIKSVTGAGGGNKGNKGGDCGQNTFKVSENFKYSLVLPAYSGGPAHSGGGGGASPYGAGGEGGGSPTIHGSSGGTGAGGGGGQKAKKSYGGNGGGGLIAIYY